MTHAIQIQAIGGPEVMQWREVSLMAPRAGEIRVRNTAIGLNFIDCYHRSGLYPLPLPSGLGLEAAGRVEAVGTDVSGFAIGDRVATIGPPVGAYAETRLIPASRVLRIPDEVTDQAAAAAMMKGLTAHYLLFRTWPVKNGETVLIHAAAGGVGQIMTQWAKHLGARVIGAVGSDAKAEIARSRGCDHVINYNRKDFTQRVREITHGNGVDVVYDSVGAATFD